MTDAIYSNAVLSPDGVYRYCLVRRWEIHIEDGDTLLWVMLNPSTADATEDDATIRKITKFSKAWGYSALAVVNVFGYRATDPRILLTVDDPVGSDNLAWIESWVAATDRTICAWGASFPKAMEPHVQAVSVALRDRGAMCMGRTKAGHPRHPLYLKDDTVPEEF